jgi:predicted nucleic acid-binding protein
VHLSRTELSAFASGLAISILTVAELVGGPLAARRPFERARREKHLRQVEATIDALPFDMACARAYGRVSGAIEAVNRKSRGSRMVDLMIAATALAHGLPLLTRNPKDLYGLEHLIEIVDVGA